MSVSTDVSELSGDDDPTTDRQSNTLRNGLLGGVVGLVLSFLPFSTVLGGTAAGYLEGGTAGDGAAAGLVAGLTALVGPAVGAVAVLALPGVAVPLPAASLATVVGAVLFVASVYVLGFSVLGGIVGAYVRTHVRE